MNTQAIGIRTARAALFTALCMTLSAGAHVLLSSLPLPLPALMLISGVVFTLAFTLAGTRERGYRSIAALLIPLELTADTVFTTGQHTCYGPAGGPVAGPLRSMGLDLICGGGTLGTPLARAAASGDGSALMAADTATPWLLLAAHVTVGLAAAAWLWRGEVALAQLLRAVAALTFRPLLNACASVGVRREPPFAPSHAAEYTPAVRTRLLTHSVGRRGPPCRAS
ncbi:MULTISPECIES: hypothetical protein [unclassified Streptomyces]|uniref:hypothetical protein n=1 Tax=unclassified Streptomyces TaxID=2593676 RepID=UPI001F034E67|nr:MULTISPECIES: hypothetical protein [unclassified Streptomyces]MCH0562800.1 hypothetical protein [Streptomyces sp. MUM 2J]MCH0567689.1 hypothetical protein [Streptomyces sp. MUM 136J]